MIPEEIAKMITAAREKEEQEKTRRLQEVEARRLEQERDAEKAFDAFLEPLLPLIPETLRAYVCLPQRFDHVPSDYHFEPWKPWRMKHFALDIPGLSPIIVAVEEDGATSCLIPGVSNDNYGDDYAIYNWYDCDKTGDIQYALPLAQKAHDYLWETRERLLAQAENRRREREAHDAAIKRLVERIVEDPLLRLLAQVVAQVQADRSEFDERLAEAEATMERRLRTARSEFDERLAEAEATMERRLRTARSEASSASDEAQRLRLELDDLERQLQRGLGRWG